MTGKPDAGDTAFWEALGIPPELRAGIVESAAVTEIWPDNLGAFELFGALQTQWRSGFGGPTGLDYSAVPVVMDLHEVAPTQRRRMFDDLRVMEAEALKVFSDNHGRK